MAKDSESRRAWVKNAAIIFLVILLLLTFFSNTILNYSLPEVSAQYPKYGTLTSAVKVDGTIKANASYNVVYEADQAEAEGGTIQSRKVVSVYVKEGDIVSKDSPILELQGGASQQLETVQKEYDTLKREYDLALLDDTVESLTSDKTIADAKKAIQDAKNELAELETEYYALLGGADNTSLIEARKERLEEEIEVLTEQRETVKEKIQELESKISSAEGVIEEDIFSSLTVAEKLAIAEEDFSIAEESYHKLSREVEFYKEQLDDITEASGDITEANSLTSQLRSLEEQVLSLEKQFDRDEEDYLQQRGEILTDIYYVVNTPIEDEPEAGPLPDQGTGEENSEPDAPAAAAVENAKVSIDEEQLKNLYDQLDALDKSYKRSSEDAMEEIESLYNQIDELEDKLDIIGMPEVDDLTDYAVDYDLAQAKKAYDKASADLAEVTEKYNTAKTSVESLRKQNAAENNIIEYEELLATYEAEEASLEEQLKQKNKELKAADKELSGITAPKDPESVADQIQQTKDNIASLEVQLKITEATQDKSIATTKLTREDQLKKLDELAAKIESYKNAPETTSVTAPIAGKIVSVNYVPGDTVTSGNTVASIEIADKGYICEITMSSEEARKIQVGAPCTVVNNWWYSNIEASVSQIRSDPSSQGKNRIVVIEVKGDVSEGQSVKFSIGDKSQSYDTVLPNSAIREDNDGKFVLVVESKNSPLGVKYTARRMDIEIIASDDTQSAVSGLYGSEFVVTNSTVPISDNQRVRLADNG